ncbi:MAG: metallophosphoesterase family protein [Sandaracinaceae bacterium]|nr:MAG: metallophosphoesterase family protein [Sandaracinaceae bacterium]
MLRALCLCAAALTLLGCDDGAPADDDAGPAVNADSGVDGGGVPPEVCMGPPTGTPPELPDPPALEPGPELDCGAPEFIGDSPLWRWPYLESVTASSARVAWTSTGGGRAVVRWAPSPDGPWQEVEATAEMFPTDRTEQARDYVGYDATLRGLSPNAAYCYEIVEDGVVLARNLRLDTAWDGTGRPVRILALGDSGSGSDDQLAVRDAFMERSLEGGEHDIFLHLGDMAYGSGTFSEFEERFFDIYQGLMHRVPVYPTMGNHEAKTDNGQPYLDVYHLPEVALREADQERYYSFDYGNAHFTVLDSNDASLIPIFLDVNGRITDDMFDWMVEDIGGSDADWQIVVMHHPFYSSSERGIRHGTVEQFRSVLEELGVDLILAGHDHHYERSVPLYGGCTDVEPRGLTEIIAGGSGASLRTIEPGQWFSAAAYNEDYSYLSLEIHGCVAHGRALNTANEVVDEFDLYGCD